MLYLGLGILVGLMLGSFIKVLADRSINNKSFLGRSYCPSCKHKLSYYDLFPILSYLSTQGKCRYCHKKISLEYPQIEILTGLLVGLLFFLHLPPLNSLNTLNLSSLLDPSFILPLSDLIFKTFIIIVLVTVLLTDLKTGLIPDRITYPSVVIALIYLIAMTVLKIYFIYQSLLVSPLGKYLLPPDSDYFYRHALLAATPLWTGILAVILIIIFFGGLIILTRGRGMGGGDLKLGVFLGLVFGLPNLVAVLFIAFLTGSIVGLVLLLIKRKQFGQTIPFGPFLSLGGLLVLFWGDQIINWYTNFGGLSIF